MGASMSGQMMLQEESFTALIAGIRTFFGLGAIILFLVGLHCLDYLRFLLFSGGLELLKVRILLKSGSYFRSYRDF